MGRFNIFKRFPTERPGEFWCDPIQATEQDDPRSDHDQLNAARSPTRVVIQAQLKGKKRKQNDAQAGRNDQQADPYFTIQVKLPGLSSAVPCRTAYRSMPLYRSRSGSDPA